jgi:ATP-dependent DNA helicase RecQ
MPTGGGKSIAFQVPALVLEGVCIVVTPLIALMKDQVQNLRKRNIRAAAIYSGQSHDEVIRHLDNAVLGAYDLLYLSPERLETELLQTKLRRMKVSFITIDEAHCISQWGYDFRPSYLNISHIRKILPGIPVLALTATATPKVVKDICWQLSHIGREGRLLENLPTNNINKETAEEKEDVIEGFHVYRMSFARPNLNYILRQVDDKVTEIIHILKSVEGSAIVYTRNRKGTQELSDILNKAGIAAINYHAGLTNIDKDVRSRAWQDGEIRVMVATNAFGMGIDKPDVRLVLHLDVPDSLEAYFQEAGRAGRDGMNAYAVLLHNKNDQISLMRRVADNFPPKEYVQRVYNEVCYYLQLAVGDGYQVSREFRLDKFCLNFKHYPARAESALALLTKAGYIDYKEDDETCSRLLFLVKRDDLYHLRYLGNRADNVIAAILRHYCGIFSSYVFIEEEDIARDCEMTSHEVYETLMQLTAQRIIHYVPAKKVPKITFLTRRVDENGIVLRPEVYEDRRQQYLDRVSEVLDYLNNEEYCRSRFLLEYFGDSTGSNCGRCDICREQKSTRKTDTSIQEKIKEVLSDGNSHAVQDLMFPSYNRDAIIQVLQEMCDAEIICLVEGRYKINE